MRADGSTARRLTWWFVSGVVIGAMWYGTADGLITHPNGEPIEGFVQFLLAGCLAMADAEMPYVTGDGKSVILLIAVS